MVAGGIAAPDIVVVHSRKIVVYQRVCVYILHGAGVGEHEVLRYPEHVAGCEDQHRPDAFSACEKRLLHGRVKILAHRIDLGEKVQNVRFDKVFVFFVSGPA